MTGTTPTPAPSQEPAGHNRLGESARALLRLIALIAVLDALLLVALLVASFNDAEELVSVLGPVHGLGFLAELLLAVRGAGERYWGWWFPALILVTLGPPGALIGHWWLTRDPAPA